MRALDCVLRGDEGRGHFAGTRHVGLVDQQHRPVAEGDPASPFAVEAPFCDRLRSYVRNFVNSSAATQLGAKAMTFSPDRCGASTMTFAMVVFPVRAPASTI